MNELVDIHAHVLPGIDDGPEDLAEAVAMAQAAVEARIGTIVATPHLRPDFPGVHVSELAGRCAQLREELGRREIPLRVVVGSEVSLVWALEADDAQLALASFDQRGTDVLIETPGDVTMIEQLIFAVRARGFRVTLAHPERSPMFQREPQRLQRMIDQGVLLQVNASALLAPRSRPNRNLADRLCRQGLAHVIASDGHRARAWRPVSELPDGMAAAAALIGTERARWMASAVPAAIIAGAPLPPAPEIEANHRSWWQARRRR